MVALEKQDSDIENATEKVGKRIIIIEGVRENGSKFRPSDWLERISSAFASFGKDQRLRYSSEIRPSVINGQRVLVVESTLEWHSPKRFNAVLKFARDNQLVTREEILL